MNIEKRAQLVAQCKAIVHLANTLSAVHGNLAKLYATTENDAHVDFVGDLTAARMETLGNMLNGMDAVTQEDEVLSPVFEAAHRLWPQPLI